MGMDYYIFDYSKLSNDELNALAKRINGATETGWHDILSEKRAYFSLKKGVSPDFLRIPDCCNVRPYHPR